MSIKIKPPCLFVLLILLATAMTLYSAPSISYAHAPQRVVLTYQPGTNNLNVTVSHNHYAENHYIKKIEIRKNGKVVDEHHFGNQAKETFVYAVTVNAAPGDVLEAKATCNRFGSKSEKLTVSE